VEQSCSAVGRRNDEQKQGQLETHKTWYYTGLPDKKVKQIFSQSLAVNPLKKITKTEYLFSLTLKKTNKTVFTISL